MTPGTKSLAFAGTSAVFFTPIGLYLSFFLPVVAGSRVDLPWFGSDYFVAVPAVLGLISVIGCILLLSQGKKLSRLWYFGIPLGITLTVITVSSFLSPLPLSPDLMFPNKNTGQAALFLLAPSSALFFYGEKKIHGCGRGLVIISLLVSILSAVLLYGLIFPPQYAPGEHVFGNPYELYFWVYYLLGLPIVGALFLSRAFGFYHPDSKPDNLTTRTPEETP